MFVPLLALAASEPNAQPELRPSDGVLAEDSERWDPGCKPGMVRIRKYCIDQYEAPNIKGVKPLVMFTATDAQAWCKEQGKRLCKRREWERACEGDDKDSYPYGSTWKSGACNDEKLYMPVDEKLLSAWPKKKAKKEVARVWQGDLSGDRETCASSKEVFDLTGNVEEWVMVGDKPVLKGCYWNGCYSGKKPTCRSQNEAHGPQFRYYNVGFRCCMDAVEDPDKLKEL